MQTLTYREAADQILAQAIEELAEGDSGQAAEKGWEAAEQMIKAVASDRGWDHHDRPAVFAVIDRLFEETGDNDIRRRFMMITPLCENFCEIWGSADYVAEGLEDVSDLLDKLEPLLGVDGKSS